MLEREMGDRLYDNRKREMEDGVVGVIRDPTDQQKIGEGQHTPYLTKSRKDADAAAAGEKRLLLEAWSCFSISWKVCLYGMYDFYNENDNL